MCDVRWVEPIGPVPAQGSGPSRTTTDASSGKHSGIDSLLQARVDRCLFSLDRVERDHQ